MAVKKTNPEKLFELVLAARFREVCQQFDADKFFQENAQRIMMHMGVAFGREGVIAFSTVLKFFKDGVIDLAGRDPVSAAMEFFQYLKAESEFLPLELVYDGDDIALPKTHRKTKERQKKGKAGKTAKQQIIDHKELGNGDEATARKKLISMLKKAAREQPSGAVANVGHQLIDDFKIGTTMANIHYVVGSFDINSREIIDKAAKR